MLGSLSNFTYFDIVISLLTIYIFPDNLFIKNLFIQDSLIVSSGIFYNKFINNDSTYSSKELYNFNLIEKYGFYFLLNLTVSLLYSINLLPAAINFLLLFCTPTFIKLITQMRVYKKIKKMVLNEFNGVFATHYLSVINSIPSLKFHDVKLSLNDIKENADTPKLLYYYLYYNFNIGLAYFYNTCGYTNRLKKGETNIDVLITELFYQKNYDNLYKVELYDYLIDHFLDQIDLYKVVIQNSLTDLLLNYIQFLLFYSISHYSIIVTLVLYYIFSSYKLLKENQTVTSFILVHVLYILRLNFIASCYLIIPFEINDQTINIVDIKEYVILNFINGHPLLYNVNKIKENYFTKEQINKLYNLNYNEILYYLFGNNKDVFYKYVLLYSITNNWVGLSLVHML